MEERDEKKEDLEDSDDENEESLEEVEEDFEGIKETSEKRDDSIVDEEDFDGEEKDSDESKEIDSESLSEDSDEIVLGKDEKVPKEDFKKQNNQVKWALFIMVGIVVIVVLVPYIKMNYFDKFNYKGLDFQKTTLGDLVFYSTRFPVVSGTGQVTGSYSVNLRNDPRDLEYIPVNVKDNKIKFARDGMEFGNVYISLYPFMEMCEDTGIAMATLSGFLTDSGLYVQSGVTDNAYARDNNQTHKWCSPFETVIVVSDRGEVFTEGNETSISEIGANCYEIKFDNCEVMQASEKFMMVILEEYAERFGGG